MHTIRLNIQDDIFEKFMGLVEILPKGSIVLEEVDEIPHYPDINFEEAQNKVTNAVADISKGYGKESNKVFNMLLGK